MVNSPAWELEGKGWEGASWHSKTAVAATTSLRSSENTCAAVVDVFNCGPKLGSSTWKVFVCFLVVVYCPSHTAVLARAGLGLDA